MTGEAPVAVSARPPRTVRVWVETVARARRATVQGNGRGASLVSLCR